MIYRCNTCGLASRDLECRRCGDVVSMELSEFGVVFSFTHNGLILVMLDGGQIVMGKVSEEVHIGDPVKVESLADGKLLFRRDHV